MSFSRTVFSKIPIIEMVSPAVKQLRQSQCMVCIFRKPKTGSCGTLIIGETVEWKDEKVRLCGCVTDEKTEFKNQHCPIKKW